MSNDTYESAMYPHLRNVGVIVVLGVMYLVSSHIATFGTGIGWAFVQLVLGYFALSLAVATGRVNIREVRHAE